MSFPRRRRSPPPTPMNIDSIRWFVVWALSVIAALCAFGAVVLLRPAHLYRQQSGEGLAFAWVAVLLAASWSSAVLAAGCSHVKRSSQRDGIDGGSRSRAGASCCSCSPAPSRACGWSVRATVASAVVRVRVRRVSLTVAAVASQARVSGFDEVFGGEPKLQVVTAPRHPGPFVCRRLWRCSMEGSPARRLSLTWLCHRPACRVRHLGRHGHTGG